jgi:hypothetical protein
MKTYLSASSKLLAEIAVLLNPVMYVKSTLNGTASVGNALGAGVTVGEIEVAPEGPSEGTTLG